MAVPTREEADAVLATQPWARVCKELTLYVTELSGTPQGAEGVALEAIARARAELWSFGERPLWMFLTEHLSHRFAGDGDDARERAERARAAAARIPMLGNEELNRELVGRGLDPEGLAALGGRIKREAIERAPRRAPASAAQASPPKTTPRRPPAPRRARRPELPTLSPAQWAALSFVVLVVAALAILGAVAASRLL
jgi:hypothetical protein